MMLAEDSCKGTIYFLVFFSIPGKQYVATLYAGGRGGGE